MMQADWRDKIKTLKEAAKPAENLSAKQQMIRAATRSIKILDDRILQHVVAINELHNRHRMEPGNTKIVNAQMILQTELAKLYKAKQTIVKHRLAIAAEITKFGAADLSLAASGAGEKQEHEQSKDPAKKITDADKKPSWKQILKQKIVAAAATAGVPWVEEDHKRDHGKFAKKDGGSDTDNKDQQVPNPESYSGIEAVKPLNKLQTKGHEEIGKISKDDQKKIMQAVGADIEYTNLGEILFAGMSRTTNPNSAYSSTTVKQAWTEAIKVNPKLSEIQKGFEDETAKINTQMQKKFDDAKTIYRGIDGDELDTIIARKTHKMMEPYNYTYLPLTLGKEQGLGFGKNAWRGLTLEFDADMLKSDTTGQIEPMKYDFYTSAPNAEKGDQYPVSYADEEEVQMNHIIDATKKGVIKKIIVHVSEDARHKEDVVTDEDIAKYKEAMPHVEIERVHHAAFSASSGSAPSKRISQDAAGAGLDWKDAIKSWKKLDDSANSK